MGCICNQNVRDEKISPTIFAPVLLLAGVVGLFVDYLDLGVHAPWWYGAAAAAGFLATLRFAPQWQRPSAGGQAEAVHDDAACCQGPDDDGSGGEIQQRR